MKQVVIDTNVLSEPVAKGLNATTKGLSIRKALPEDAYEYTATHIACWRSAYKGIISDEFLDGMNVEQRAESIRSSLSDSGNSTYYCMEFNGKMIGRLIISQNSDTDKPNSGEIVAMYLIDAFWGRGYGRQIMDFAINEFKRIGCNEIFLWVLKANYRGRTFYEKCGFTFDGTKREFTIDKPHVIMRYIYSL